MVQIQIIIISYLVVINLMTFVLYGIDKKRAIRNEHRIKEGVLLWIARLGGAIGSWLGIKLFRHKTKHTKFRVVVPLWRVDWIAIIILGREKNGLIYSHSYGLLSSYYFYFLGLVVKSFVL